MIKEFTIGFSRTINLGNYESARVEASVKYELNEGENFEDAQKFLQEELTLLLKETMKIQFPVTTPFKRGSEK